MPPVADKDHIRTILRRDPAWTVYALGDLSPRMFDKCRWYTPDLTMILRDYGTTILFATGPGSIREALSEVTGAIHLQVKADALDEIASIATVTAQRLMWRMVWRPGSLPSIDPQVTRLEATDVSAIELLYADGASAGESPDFFYPSMVSDGVFFGVYEGAALVGRGHALGRPRRTCGGHRQRLYAERSPRPRSWRRGHRRSVKGTGRHRDDRTQRPRR